MSNPQHTGTTNRTCRDTTTRRQFLSALGAGALGVAALEVSSGTPGAPQSEATFTSNHEVRIDDRTAQFQIDVPKARYQQVVDADHSYAAAFEAARHQPYLAPVMAGLAKRVPTRASAILAAQSLVVGIAYMTDEESTGDVEFVRYPAETLVHGCGDCEDKAILLAGLLSRPPLNCRTALLIVPHHCATLVAREDLPPELIAGEPVSVRLDGTEYIYLEAVERVQPGQAALDYGDRPHVAAYTGQWVVMDAAVLLDWGTEELDRRGVALFDDVFM